MGVELKAAYRIKSKRCPLSCTVVVGIRVLDSVDSTFDRLRLDWEASKCQAEVYCHGSISIIFFSFNADGHAAHGFVKEDLLVTNSGGVHTSEQRRDASTQVVGYQWS